MASPPGAAAGGWHTRMSGQPFKCKEPRCKLGWQYGEYREDKEKALRAVGRRFGDHAPYIPLGHPPDRARRHKGNYGWTLRTMLWALEEFYVIGTFVPIAPEIAVAGRRETEYPEPLYVAASSQGV
ncbi:unnamed protein product [Ectocarpus sp. 6 AP-2014]